MLSYKGYEGAFEIDSKTGTIFGRVLGITAVVTFQAETLAGAEKAFRDSVDDYLDFY